MPSLIRSRSGSSEAPAGVLNNANNNANSGRMASRKRKRGESTNDDSVSHSTDDEEVVAAKKLKSKTPSKLVGLLKSIGRHIGRYVSLTANIQNALLRTHLANEQNDDSGSDDEDDDVIILKPYQIKTQETIFKAVNARHQQLISNLDAEMLALLSKSISSGMHEAHNHDVRNFKRHIVTIYELVDPPEKKMDWGFQYACTASLLRPIDVEEGSSQWDELCAGDAFAKATEWAAFMWDGRCGPTDEEDITVGFLMDSALIKAARLVLFPPSFLNKSMAAGSGFAKDWDIKTVSSGLIAYVVELVRFSLSSESNYANVDFDYTKFYDGLVAHLNDPGLKEQNRRIHDFWNEQLFSNVAPTRKQKKAKRNRQPTTQISTTARFLAQVSRAGKENADSGSRLETLAAAASAA